MIQNNRLSAKQAILLIVMFIIGSSSLIVTGLAAKKDIWVAILLAGGASVLIMLMYARLLTALPGKDFYDTLEHFFGKVGSKIALASLTWYALHYCSLVLGSYGHFIITVGLKETPLVIALAIMIVVCLFSVRNGIEVLGRWNENFVFYLLGFLILSILLVSRNFNVSNFLPILDQGILPVAKGTFSVTIFPFAQTVVFLLVFPAFKKNVSVKKVYLLGLLFGGIIILVLSATNILVLGTGVAENMYYPFFSTLATVDYGDFLSRFEILAGIVFIIGVFLKLSIILFSASKGIAKIFSLNDHRSLAIPVTFIIVNLVLISFDGSMIYSRGWQVKVYPYYATVFEIIIPLILLIIIEVKRRKKGKVRA